MSTPQNKVKGFFADFKKFITKGNIVELAIAVVIGAAFGKIVTALVDNIIMPLISLLVGGTSIADWKWVITPAVVQEGVTIVAESAVKYGLFLQAIIDFLIIAFVIFLALRVLMSLQRKWQQLENELTNTERRTYVQSLIQQGMSKAQISDRLAALEAEKAAAAAAAAEAKRKESVEYLLKEIRDILVAQKTPPKS